MSVLTYQSSPGGVCPEKIYDTLMEIRELEKTIAEKTELKFGDEDFSRLYALMDGIPEILSREDLIRYHEVAQKKKDKSQRTASQVSKASIAQEILEIIRNKTSQIAFSEIERIVSQNIK